jgi:hypothetical protein
MPRCGVVQGDGEMGHHGRDGHMSEKEGEMGEERKSMCRKIERINIWEFHCCRATILSLLSVLFIPSPLLIGSFVCSTDSWSC